jgi:cephalosporin-C deacetylase-like acetyl esterase
MSKYLKCTTDKNAVSYKCGEKIVFSVVAMNNCQPTTYGSLRWTLEGDDGKKSQGIFEYDNGKPLIIETTLDRPGFVLLTVSVYDKSANFDSNFDKLEAGAGAEIEKLEYFDTIPDDFDEYWADIEALVASHTPVVTYEREITQGVPTGFRAFDVRVSVPCDGRDASGILTYPDDGKKHPLCVAFQGYAISPAIVEYIDDFVTIKLNAHGIRNDRPRFMAEFDYPELKHYGFNEKENSSNMTTYWRNMMIRNLTAVKYAKSLDVWDGKGIVSYGGSQGALQATTVAAHDKDVTYLDIFIPWFCNLSAESHGYMKGWRPRPAEGLRYFDTVAQATRVKCPTRISARLGDYVCPPSTTSTLYNCFNTVKGIDFIQAGTHPYLPPEQIKFRLRYDPSNPNSELKLGKYRHYKGGEYELVALGTDSESLEETVIYKSTTDGQIWVRPRYMFEEYVAVKGIPVKRFEYIGE